MIKKIYVGKNSVGKTKLMEEEKKDLEKIIYIQTEVKHDEDVKTDNKGSGTFLIDQILPIIFEKIAYDIDEVKNTMLTDIQNKIEACNNNVVNKFKKNDKWKLEKMISNDIVTEFNNLGSGDKNYEILKMLKNLEIEEYNIFIDEPEKFAHPTLIIKIANIINELASNNNIYIVSHSPLLIRNLKIDNIDVFNLVKSERDIRKINNDDIKETLKEIVDRNNQVLLAEGGNILESITMLNDFSGVSFEDFMKYYFVEKFKDLVFYDSPILVEDYNTSILTNKICDNLGVDSEVLIVDGKVMIWFWNKVCEKLELIPFKIYDKDGDNEEHRYYNDKIKNNPQYFIELLNNVEEEFGLDLSSKNHLKIRVKLLSDVPGRMEGFKNSMQLYFDRDNNE